MALKPIDEFHALQIQAGTSGRNAGHSFEDDLSEAINKLTYPVRIQSVPKGKHLFEGVPAELVLTYVANHLGIKVVAGATAVTTGTLATSEAGRKILEIDGKSVRKCKSDVVLTIKSGHNTKVTIGLSVKQCNNKTPTNAQLYFTTANGFAKLLSNHKIQLSTAAVTALKQFCGEPGHRPSDRTLSEIRRIDTRRWFWEEIDSKGRIELETVLKVKQDEITKLLIQKAYLDDPFVPDYIVHKTRKAKTLTETELAIYSVDEFVECSSLKSGFMTKDYSVRKGSFPDPTGIAHQAPRFGYVQMQRGGQQQHPSQLQFNLQAGYFYSSATDGHGDQSPTPREVEQRSRSQF